MKAPDAISAIRRSDQAWCAQLATGDPLTFGVAYVAPEFSALSQVNQLRDVWLADVDPAGVYALAENYFAARKSRCTRWVPAADQPVEPVEAILAPHGWRRVEQIVWTLPAGAGLNETSGDLRILPARAMRRAYSTTFVDASPDAGAAAQQRMDDANLDAFVAVRDGEPLGRMGYFEVGDIARLADLYVLPAHRRKGVGTALVDHFAQLARRLLPKLVVAACDADDADAAAFLRHCGLIESGTATEFVRGEPSPNAR